MAENDMILNKVLIKKKSIDLARISLSAGRGDSQWENARID